MIVNKDALFDTFNARNLSLEEVASTFIPNKQFEDLIENNHSLLMGPRGSGKTTLLKMLTPAALKSWNTKKSKFYKEKISFCGIYIPTDTQFKRQIDYIKDTLPEKDYKIVSNAIITSNVLVHLTRTLIFLTKESSNNLEKEIELSSTIINVWKLDRPISPTLYSIEQAIFKRIIIINNFLNKIMFHQKKSEEIVYPEFFYDSFLPLCEFACTSFESIYTKSSNFKWALCFDELELAPDWLQGLLFGYMRSTSQKFLFKLTTSPIISLSSVITDLSATSFDDYRIVRTWPINNNEIKKWNSFCSNLIEDRLFRRYESSVTAKYIFGDDDIERTAKYIINGKITNKQDSYGENGFSWLLIKEYAKIDPGFKKMLVQRSIDPKNPVPSGTRSRDTFFRKVRPIVFFRYNFKSEAGLRSRKNPPLYYGIPYIYEVCDGNPRQLIGLVDELLRKVSRDENNNPRPVSVLDQSETITSTSEKFLKLLETHPDANVRFGDDQLNVGQLINKIGSYFNDRIISGPFPIDPVGSFTVDAVQTPYLKLLEFALAHGAIVYVNPNEGVSHSGILGKKFRLSYLLAPLFKMPKREYSTVNLSTILSQKAPNNKLLGSQLNIFGYDT
jgi:energy-coupling factor transporter ATP-binding protein EcfA2